MTRQTGIRQQCVVHHNNLTGTPRLRISSLVEQLLAYND